MKKLSFFFAAFLAGSALATAEMTTSVNLSGSLSGTEGFVLNNTDQKDADLVQFTYEGKNTGASFRLWTKAASDTVVKIRSASLWFKPLDTLKVSLGGVGAYTYTEQLDWWQVPTASSLAQFNGWDTRWSATTAFDGDNAGVMVESTAIRGLTVSAGVAPGYGNALYTNNDKEWDQSKLKYGASARYELKGIGSVGAAYRDDGLDNQKIARVGFDLNGIKGLYTFVDLIARLDNTTASGGVSTDAMGLAGVTIDNFTSFRAGSLGIQAHLPVTVRLTGEAGDVSYFCYDVKLAYNLPGGKLVPYVRAQQDGIAFDNLKPLPTLNLGTDVGGWDGGSFSVSFQYTMAETDSTWSIPFFARVTF